MSAYQGSDPVFIGLFSALESANTQYVTVSQRLSAAEGDRDKAVATWIESTDDLKAVKLREQIATLTAKLRELGEASIKTEELTDEDKAKLSAEMDSLKDKIRQGRGVIEKVANTLSSVNPKEITDILGTITDPTRSGRGRAPGSAGSNLPRVSATVTITGGNFTEPQVCSSFSTAATQLNAEVKDLQLAFAEAAGVKHEEISTIKQPMTFSFTPNPDGDTYTITTTPKQRQKPGPNKADEAAAETAGSETESETVAAE